ncbi:hypothetical protein PsorP6_005579 [Peronosclerospora sorghi]|uniref:Uncharacterized protein n=1 Tax=Peronosclerospora sorghi TaxID=230839 RepID=A0ACC0W491_9STRA|nr:hypothetical protein PsorP6_005579 [Peronosclerospora sorghi]
MRSGSKPYRFVLLIVVDSSYGTISNTSQCFSFPSIVTKSSSISTALMKSESRFKFRISSTRNLILDGAWFAERPQ